MKKKTIENDCISRSVHRFKITQPNLTILVSFPSAEDVSSNDVKIYDIFGLQGTGNTPFRFFGTSGIRGYFCGGFNFKNFTGQTLAKISTSIYVYFNIVMKTSENLQN